MSRASQQGAPPNGAGSQLTEENAVWEQERSELEAGAAKQREELDREYSRHVQELRASAAGRAAELETKAANERALLEKWVCKSYHHCLLPLIRAFMHVFIAILQ
jgi:hypothetical protein